MVRATRGSAFLGFAATLALSVSANAAPNPDCNGDGASIVADTKEHRIWLCEASVASKEFKIAIGRGGTDKRKQGDLKTPLGTYPLGNPRASIRFGTFIPIEYPTAEQSKQGLTGKDVGIHGPDRRFRWLGSANTWMDWTQGCIAVAADSEIEEIANWLKAKKPQVIRIR